MFVMLIIFIILTLKNKVILLNNKVRIINLKEKDIYQIEWKDIMRTKKN